MKKTTILLPVLLLIMVSNSFAQTIYTVNSNSDYSANCNSCTFNISPGVTLTITEEGVCNACTFNGGKLAVNSNLVCQPCSFNNNNIALNSGYGIELSTDIPPYTGVSSFNGVVLTANSTSSLVANTPLSITNSNFTFSSNSFFDNRGGQLDITNSTLNFFEDAYFIANDGPVNLKSGTKIFAGNGAINSHAYVKINGPKLNIYDAASSINLGNNNNYYFNWDSYNSISNSQTFETVYPNPPSLINCDGAGQNPCGMWSEPTVYGPSAFTSNGVHITSSTLPVILAAFSITNTGLSWTTAEEVNADYFSVEYSITGTGFEKIGTVAAKNTSSHYTYAVSENGYYRIMIVDKNGAKTFSDVKLFNAGVVKGVKFYPNPAVDVINVSVAEESTVQLLNQAGQVLLERKSSGKTTLDVKQIPRGIYILKVIGANGSKQINKLMIAH